MNDSFDSDTLRLIDGAREVRIETSRDEDAPAHHTTIWVVTVDGSVFVRSLRGGKGSYAIFRTRDGNWLVHRMVSQT